MKYDKNNSKYTWAHIVTGFSGAYRKSTRFHARQQSDNSCWVGTFTWGSPIVATAPPSKTRTDATLGLNVGTLLDFVDKRVALI